MSEPNKHPWYLGLSAYWYATSLKWFLLFFLTPSVVNRIVPGGEQNRWWGYIVAIGAAEAMIGPAIMGWLSDRTQTKWGRRRPFIALGAALTAFALLAMGQSNSIWLLMGSYLFIQMSDDIGTGPYSSAIPELVPEKGRGKAAGSMGLLQLLGQVTAVAIGLLLGSDPWLIFLTMAVVNVVCAAISIAAIARLEREHKLTERPVQKLNLATLWTPLKDPDFRWAWFTRFLNALGFYVVLNYLLNFLKDVVKTYDLGFVRFDEPFQATIAMAALLSLTGAFSSVWNGKRADRVGRKRVVIQAGVIMFAALAAFVFVSEYRLIAPLAIVFGFGYGAYLSADWALVSDVLPDRDNPARDMGVWQMSVAAPQVFSGLIGGLIDWGNILGDGLGYRIAFGLASVALLMGSLLVTRIKGST
jgi:MFS family permease